jgi:hypothetical protein
MARVDRRVAAQSGGELTAGNIRLDLPAAAAGNTIGRPPERTMGSEIKGQRLAALFLLGCLLFNYPLLYLFNVSTTVFGIPLLYAYVFVAWALLIVLLGIVVERSAR